MPILFVWLNGWLAGRLAGNATCVQYHDIPAGFFVTIVVVVVIGIFSKCCLLNCLNCYYLVCLSLVCVCGKFIELKHFVR